MSLLQRYNKVILTVAAIIVVPSAVYGGVVLREKFSPTYHSAKLAAVEDVPTNRASKDRRKSVQDELKALLDEREEVQRKIDEVKSRIAKRPAS